MCDRGLGFPPVYSLVPAGHRIDLLGIGLKVALLLALLRLIFLRIFLPFQIRLPREWTLSG